MNFDDKIKNSFGKHQEQATPDASDFTAQTTKNFRHGVNELLKKMAKSTPESLKRSEQTLVYGTIIDDFNLPRHSNVLQLLRNILVQIPAYERLYNVCRQSGQTGALLDVSFTQDAKGAEMKLKVDLSRPFESTKTPAPKVPKDKSSPRNG